MGESMSKRKPSKKIRHDREEYKIVWRSYKKDVAFDCARKIHEDNVSYRNNQRRNKGFAPLRRPYPKRYFYKNDIKFKYLQDVTTHLFFKYKVCNIRARQDGSYELEQSCTYDNRMNMSGLQWDNKKDCYRCIHLVRSHDLDTCEINDILRFKLSKKKNIIYDTNTIWECEAKEIIPDGIFIVENKDEMIRIIEKSRNFFSSPEDHEEFWGCNPNYDDDGIYTETIHEYVARGGGIDHIPNFYPAAVFLRPQDCKHLVWHELKFI